MNVRKFRENSGETVPVSAICDEYCTPLEAAINYWEEGGIISKARAQKF